MSAPRPNPADEPEIPPTSSSGPADGPAGESEEVTVPPATELPAAALPAEDAEEPTATPRPAEEVAGAPPADEPAGTPATGETTDAPPTAELIVTPAVTGSGDAPLTEEDAPLDDLLGPPADTPAWAKSATAPPGEPLDGGPLDGDPLGADTGAGAEPVWAQVARRPTFGQTVVMVTGVLLFIWGFLPWYSDAGGSANAWSTVTIPGLLLTATWVPLLSLAIAVFVAIKAFANGFPDRIFGFSWAQLSLVVGVFDALISLGFLVANRRLGNLGSLDIGVGLILSFITSLVMITGGIFDHLGMGREEILTRLRAPANAPRNRQ